MKNYISLEMKVFIFDEEDVITTSQIIGTDDKDVTGNDIYNGFEG